MVDVKLQPIDLPRVLRQGVSRRPGGATRVKIARVLCGLLVLVLGTGATRARAQGDAPPAAEPSASGPLVLPVRVVNGHLMVVGFVADRDGDVHDLSLEVSFEHPGVVTLHGHYLLAFLEGMSTVPLMLKPDTEFILQGDEIESETRQERIALHNEMTRLYSGQLDEHKVKGTLGTGFLRKYHVVLDVAAGTLTLTPRAGGGEGGGGAPLAGDLVSGFELRNGRLWIPLQHSGGQSGSMLFGGDAYDSLINSEAAQRLGRPAGDVAPVWLGAAGATGGVDLSRQMAFRPSALALDGRTVPEGAFLVSGVNLLEAFRVEIDWAGEQIAFTRTQQREDSSADRAYFRAALDGSSAKLSAYLKEYPESRLSAEAAERLIEARLEQPGASDDQLVQALRWVVDTSPPERKMENAAGYVQRFRQMPDRSALVVRAGKLALEHSRDAVTVQDTYRMHNVIGEAYLAQDEVIEAWKHFLSAAFMPLDQRTDFLHNVAVNLNLGRVYERMGRPMRAYSRYFRAQEMLGPALEQIAEMPEDAELPPGANRIDGFGAEIAAALKRLKAEIPADEIALLEE